MFSYILYIDELNIFHFNNDGKKSFAETFRNLFFNLKIYIGTIIFLIY